MNVRCANIYTQIVIDAANFQKICIRLIDILFVSDVTRILPRHTFEHYSLSACQTMQSRNTCIISCIMPKGPRTLLSVYHKLQSYERKVDKNHNCFFLITKLWHFTVMYRNNEINYLTVFFFSTEAEALFLVVVSLLRVETLLHSLLSQTNLSYKLKVRNFAHFENILE